MDAQQQIDAQPKQMDPQLKQLMKELGDAINESLSDSEQISEVVSRIKEAGYDIFLVLEAKIGVSKKSESGTTDKVSVSPSVLLKGLNALSQEDAFRRFARGMCGPHA
jgi:hypothetical protein